MNRIFAIPTENGQLCQHFGHCQAFTLVHTNNDQIEKQESITPPAHQPGVYPGFLAELGVKVVIAGGMGEKAQQLFAQNNIEVMYGVDADTAENLVNSYLAGTLQGGHNRCDH